MKIVCCQFDIAWEDQAANFKKVRSLLEGARLQPGSLVLLPEMFAAGFSMNVGKIAANGSSETDSFLAGLARELGIYLLGGAVGRASDGRGENLSTVFSPTGGEVARYSKMHPFAPGGEAMHYQAGKEIVLFDWQGFSVAPFICYDLRFPEIFRGAMLRGANLFTVIASWPDARLDHWVKLLQARAIENQAYVAGVNRCGADPRFHYSGSSLIAGPDGKILAQAAAEEGLIEAEVALSTVQNYRRELPFLADTRKEFLPG